MRLFLFIIASLLFMPIAASDSHAQAAGLVISQDQKWLLAAGQKLAQRDFRSAESMCSQAIASNPRSYEAYLQRAVIRRELANREGMRSDASAALAIIGAALERQPNNPEWYYHRSRAMRLLRNFQQARQDLNQALQLGGKSSWRGDLTAISLEEKMPE